MGEYFNFEGYTFDRPIKHHFSFKNLKDQRENIAAGRIVITQMSDDMLPRPAEPGWKYAGDGKVFTV